MGQVSASDTHPISISSCNNDCQLGICYFYALCYGYCAAMKSMKTESFNKKREPA